MSISTNERLTHLVYEASLDNSLLPELILELTEQVQMAADGRMIEADHRHDLRTICTILSLAQKSASHHECQYDERCKW